MIPFDTQPHDAAALVFFSAHTTTGRCGGAAPLSRGTGSCSTALEGVEGDEFRKSI